MRPRPAAALLLAAAAVLPAGGAAQSAPRLEGRVVLGSDSSAVAGQTVVLHRVTADTGMAVDSATSGPDGGFSLPLRGDEGDVFVVSARHAGILYFGPAVQGGTPPETYGLAVYDVRAAGPTDTLTLGSRALVLTPDPEGVHVTDVVEVRGAADRTLVGRVPVVDTGSREAWWRVRLPYGARNARVLPGGVTGGQVELAGGEARLSAPVPPGGVRLVLGYRVPRGEEVVLRTLHPADHLEVVAREDAGGVEVGGLEGPEPLASGERRYRRWSARGAEAGRSVRVAVVRSGTGGVPRTAWIAGAVGLLLAAGALAARRIGRRRGEES